MAEVAQKVLCHFKTYGAMFFWSGARDTVEGVIKKVRSRHPS